VQPKRRRLGSAPTCSATCDVDAEIGSAGAHSKERSHHKIDAYGRIGGFDFCNARLAGAQKLRKSELGHPTPKSSRFNRIRKPELQFDDFAFLSGEAEKLSGITDLPASGF
jgi:hypothetical protein